MQINNFRSTRAAVAFQGRHPKADCDGEVSIPNEYLFRPVSSVVSPFDHLDLLFRGARRYTCALHLIGVQIGAGVWCKIQNARPMFYHYYRNLALKMVGIPALMLVALGAADWIWRGFRFRV